MSEDTQAPEATEAASREILVDDVSYTIDELPQSIQGAISTYDVWVRDRGEAQKTASQLASAVQHLATQISQAIKEHTAAAEAEAGEVASAGDDALEVEAEVVEAEAALDIPAEDD